VSQGNQRLAALILHASADPKRHTTSAPLDTAPKSTGARLGTVLKTNPAESPSVIPGTLESDPERISNTEEISIIWSLREAVPSIRAPFVEGETLDSKPQS
jgi:hypothetical protein